MAQRIKDGIAFLVVAADVAIWAAMLSLGSVGFIRDPRAMASIGLISSVLLCPMSAGAVGARWWWTAFINTLGAATLALGLTAVATDGYGVLAAFVIAIAAMWVTSAAYHAFGPRPVRGTGRRGAITAGMAGARVDHPAAAGADGARGDVLVAYASRHGFTQGIAERVAETLRASGQSVDLIPAGSAGDITGYQAYVVGSAAYIGSWLRPATELVQRNQAVLAGKPVWLFSSGPLGTATTDPKGKDILEASEPKQFAEFRTVLHPRDLHVFFGGLDPDRLGPAERVVRSTPAGRPLLPQGDFRDWKAIDTWARGIAAELATPARVASGSPDGAPADL
ncbi:MAG TPA: flavodoxin domain-containing protein [Candidatus Binatia bacterium]|nr:flavodoxin domain-containing protein [Candidatus Binatia bacterium]